MDARTLPSLQFMSARRLRLHPYIRTFAAAFAAVPDGIGWLAADRYCALEVLTGDCFNGKGGTRTLDPGIMRAVIGSR